MQTLSKAILGVDYFTDYPPASSLAAFKLALSNYKSE